ncbi:MAG TPA: TonB-dependent receptor [Stenotrophomonas sp.]
MVGKTPRVARARLALAIAALLGAACAQAQAPANEPAPPVESPVPGNVTEAKTLDAVSVTGTRIKSQTMTAASPVMEINAEQFRQSGATRVEDLVNQYPQLSANFDGFTNNGATGYGTVSLRDLGANRTLTLLNGRRLPDGAEETTDVSIVPVAVLKRVDVLTGGASAVYGSDAIAGVVNFLIDDEFNGVSANVGYSGYQHDNDNGWMQQLQRDAGYDYPTGNSGLGGISRNLDLAAGGDLGENGHAMGWVSWRKNEGLLQADRDYSSCALNATGNGCGGSGTSDPTNFLVDGDFAHLNPDGRWAPERAGLYNFGPENYYQRPDERFTAGFQLKYEITPQFQPYLETAFVNHKSTIQTAPSGTFFSTPLTLGCTDPLLGSLCNDLGIDAPSVDVNIGKRNVEGGPRVIDNESTAFRIVAGARGDLNASWSYDASVLYARNDASTRGRNDLLVDRINDAVLGCPAGSPRSCVPYNVWVPNGVTPEAAKALAGTSLQDVTTSLKALSWYVNGDTGWALPWSQGDTFKVAGGMEWRSETYERRSDSDTVRGNFAGAGGPIPDIDGDYNVAEFFLEGQVPILADLGALDRFGAEFGYRYSDYSTSGSVNTYKVGLSADLLDQRLHLRGGYNRAIRAPDLSDFFRPNSIALWNGSDPCAGDTPEFTAEQCARTGVLAGQYGDVTESPAGQYNQFVGGNLALKPETADTWTLGVAFTPIQDLDLSVDYYDIRIEDAITDIGANQILRNCGETGLAVLCDRVHRAARGDLWVGNDAERSGYVSNLTDNFGNFHYRGVDLSARYRWTLGPGSLVADIVGSYVIQQQNDPIPGVPSASYDCAGVINESCNAAEWRHVANLRYSWDDYSVGMRWRHIAAVDYENTDGSPGISDELVAARDGIDAANYFDLSGSMRFAQYWEWSAGINNVFDRAPPLVGSALVDGEGGGNANSPAGYDPAGRYLFTSLSYRF